MPDFDQLRARMVRDHIQARGIRTSHVLDAMRSVPREAFVDPDLAEFSYEDTPLPIAAGQTISQPYIVAEMLEDAQLKPGDRVLEIGTGSGYAAAVASRVAAEVFTIERQAELVRSARERLAKLRYENVSVLEGDGTLGWPEQAPYDVIIVSAGDRRTAGNPDRPLAACSATRTRHERVRRPLCRRRPGCCHVRPTHRRERLGRGL
jgi:protein-L-isoaspartate(D-aspartate) O-methyltransferase